MPLGAPSEGLRAIRWAGALGAGTLVLAVWLIRVGQHILSGDAGSTSQLFADSSRALGIGTLIVLCATLPIGLLVGRRVITGQRRTQLRALHQTLSVCAVGAIGLHAVALLGATRIGPTLANLLVPFHWNYRPTATGLGVLGAWIVAALGLSYFARRKIGERRWRVAHRFIAVGLALSVLHTIGGG